MKKDKRSIHGKIVDAKVTPNDYGAFDACRISDTGDSIRFMMASGAGYEVPITYLLLWFPKPHHRWGQGKIREVGKFIRTKKQGRVRILKCRRIWGNRAVRVYFDNNFAYDITWDTVLMACEPKYQYYGGLTAESKKVTQNYRHLIRRFGRR